MLTIDSCILFSLAVSPFKAAVNLKYTPLWTCTWTSVDTTNAQLFLFLLFLVRLEDAFSVGVWTSQNKLVGAWTVGQSLMYTLR